MSIKVSILFIFFLITEGISHLNAQSIINNQANSSIFVIRKYATEITQLDTSLLRISEYLLLTINENESLDEIRFDVLFMEVQPKINSIRFAALDSEGKTVTKEKSKNVLEAIMHLGGSFKELINKNEKVKKYPYSIEIEYKGEIKSSLKGLIWLPRKNSDFLLETAYLRINVPEGVDIQYKSDQINDPSIDSDETHMSYFWEIVNNNSMDDSSSRKPIDKSLYYPKVEIFNTLIKP